MIQARSEKPPGLFQLLAKAMNPNTRRLLGIATHVAESLGGGLAQKPKEWSPT